MKTDELINSISKIEIFKSLDHLALSKLINEAHLIKANNNQVLFQEGEEGSHFYILVSGSIKLFKTDHNGKNVIMKVVKPQEIFAEVIIFNRNTYPVTSMAIEKSEVLAIQKKSFICLLDNNELRDQFISALMGRLNYLTNRVLYLSSYDVEERFFRFMIERYGIHEEYQVTISKKEIATAIGTIPETLSRLIKNLSSRGLMKWDKSTLKIDPRVWDNIR